LSRLILGLVALLVGGRRPDWRPDWGAALATAVRPLAEGK
jgi:hypothetical protein